MEHENFGKHNNFDLKLKAAKYTSKLGYKSKSKLGQSSKIKAIGPAKLKSKGR